VRVFHGDIADLDPAVLDLEPGMLDVLDGSPPCQGFSMIGKRILDDPRNQLFREFVRLLTAWQPKVFVMENVPGLVIGKMKAVFAEIMAELHDAGYTVQARVMSTEYFGVPQKRRRLVFVGIRDDLGVAPEHPRARTRPLTVRDALAGLDTPGLVAPIGGQKAPKLARIVRPGRNGADALTSYGHKLRGFGLARLDWHKPAPTLIKSFFPAGYVALLHPDDDRYVGTRELARLQSFPDEYDWADSTYMQIHNRLGNSVPPLFMHAIAETVAGILERARARAGAAVAEPA
jgi:DNA (cytosine-5)-methyltransferase 1